MQQLKIYIHVFQENINKNWKLESRKILKGKSFKYRMTEI